MADRWRCIPCDLGGAWHQEIGGAAKPAITGRDGPYDFEPPPGYLNTDFPRLWNVNGRICRVHPDSGTAIPPNSRVATHFRTVGKNWAKSRNSAPRDSQCSRQWVPDCGYGTYLADKNFRKDTVLKATRTN